MGEAKRRAANGNQPRTPGARWREEGKPDPHDNQYQCERAELAMGSLSDDELANAVFLYGDDRHVDPREVLAGTYIPPIVYLTAAKDRIRWLSRKLHEATNGASG